MLLRSGRGGGAATVAGERDTRSHGCSLLLPLDVVALMRTSCFCRWTGPHGRCTLSSEVGRRSIGRRSRRAEPLVAASLTSFPSVLASVRCPLAVARIWLYGAGSWCRTQATQTQSILTTRPGDIVCTMFCSAICHFDMAKMLAFDMCQNYVAPPA
ncbi:uncharacterized protein LOC119320189 isoform X1 [Triticum dicoccoides]|uniref:uncharacterized protein LOC119320189 isoform X1 n=1 Tax=Triticum dicoccoides TaxID=85692 RepID=UPI001890E266|nr:uncharacterized protein LOC119320189 isoform X1 [Triticum dicoccoides]